MKFPGWLPAYSGNAQIRVFLTEGISNSHWETRLGWEAVHFLGRHLDMLKGYRLPVNMGNSGPSMRLINGCHTHRKWLSRESSPMTGWIQQPNWPVLTGRDPTWPTSSTDDERWQRSLRFDVAPRNPKMHQMTDTPWLGGSETAVEPVVAGWRWFQGEWFWFRF